MHFATHVLNSYFLLCHIPVVYFVATYKIYPHNHFHLIYHTVYPYHADSSSTEQLHTPHGSPSPDTSLRLQGSKLVNKTKDTPNYRTLRGQRASNSNPGNQVSSEGSIASKSNLSRVHPASAAVNVHRDIQAYLNGAAAVGKDG